MSQSESTAEVPSQDSGECASLRDFVDEIAGKAESLEPFDLVSHGQPLPFDAAVIIKLKLDEISDRLSSIIGDDLVDEFFREFEPKEFSGSRHLGLPLARTIPVFCRQSAGKVVVDREGLYAALSKIVESVRAGVAEHSICLRVANIDIQEDFELADGIYFRKISGDEVRQKYSLDHRTTHLSAESQERLLDHRVEVVILGSGKPSELQRQLRTEECHALINSITHPFILANVPQGNPPCVTHVRVTSPIEGQIIHQGIGRFSYRPPLLTPEDVGKVQKAYAYLQDADADRVLGVATDRFIVGMKQGNHHLNRVNQPNWDKLVDYAIALESLFLTVEGRPITDELSYRFRLNGATLMREFDDRDVYQHFVGLKHLYDIRSKVVHGADDASILKIANKFIETLEIDCPDHQHMLGRLMLVSVQVEEWIRNVLLYLGSMPVEERPFRKRYGWERLLWCADESGRQE